MDGDPSQEDRIRLIGRLFFYSYEVASALNKSLRIGLGIRGIIGAVYLGFICLFQPLFENTKSLLWAKIFLVLAALVYVAFSLVWDKKFISLTTVQIRIDQVAQGCGIHHHIHQVQAQTGMQWCY